MKVLFFASLRETLGTDEISIELEASTHTIEDIKALLCQRYPTWSTAISNPLLLSALNHEMVTDDAIVTDNDELAFFPPVTGG